MINDLLATSSIRLARVTHVHPEGQKMEVIFLDTGDYCRDVQISSPYAGTDFGFTAGAPAPGQEGHDVNMTDNAPGTRHVLAVVACMQGMHVSLGYLYPQVNQMAFTKADKNRLIERHTSDVYRTISDAGDLDIVHPGGAHIRMGQGSDPDPMEGRDYDGAWRVQHNKDKSVTISLITGETSVKVTPEGDVLIHAPRKVNVDAPTIAAQATDTVVDTTNLTTNTTATQHNATSFIVEAESARITASGAALDLGAGATRMVGQTMAVEVQSADILAQDVTLDAPNITLRGLTSIDGDIDI